MINFEGYSELISSVYEFGQEHVFAYWDELTYIERKDFLRELSKIDFALLEELYEEVDGLKHEDYLPAQIISLNEREEENFDFARQLGIDYISKGKVAAFLVAGGQGSRLGFNGSKGKFPIGPVSGKSLFHFHGEKIRKAEIQYNTSIPFLVMTSADNHEETVEYFKSQSFFGLNEDNVYIFRQNMIPSIDMNGKLILASKKSIFMNPDGHGGSLYALKSSGVLAEMIKQGIETISYFQVDNPLVNIIDPLFIGLHVLKDVQVSSKAMTKAYPEEKIGIFVEFLGGKKGIIEYSDMPDEKIYAKGLDGRLLYSAGNPAIHLFSISFISSITGNEKKFSLPFHRAVKKILAFKGASLEEIEGYKFEKFVFDALFISERSLILEIIREDEFAPVKNASGMDSPESAEKIMHNLYCRWLKDKGIAVPESVKTIEISPLLSVDGTDLPSGLIVPPDEKVYLQK